MSTDLAIGDREIAVAHIKSEPLSRAVEAALATGDLAKLTTDQRVEWYRHRCAAAGLNPLSRPFEYISLQGKLTLYATKACTDQLSGIHGLSHEILARETVEGIHIVTARVSTKGGRTTTDIGAVPIAGLKGADLANALMKAVTKAKRRATLSVCGLGDVIDETELETVADARRCDSTGQIEPPRNSTSYGRGQYASPEQTDAYLDAMEAYIDRRNQEWLDRWTADGGSPDGLKELCNRWQADGHLVKWAVETGRVQVDAATAESGPRNRQIGRYTAIVYHRSKEDRAALSQELRRYIDDRAARQTEALAAKNPGLIESEPSEDEILDAMAEPTTPDASESDEDAWPEGRE